MGGVKGGRAGLQTWPHRSQAEGNDSFPWPAG